MGSVTKAMLRKVEIPILTVCRVRRPLSLNRILFAADLSEASRTGFSFALELARLTGSTLVVFHAVEMPMVTHAADETSAAARVRELEQAGVRLKEYAPEGKTANVRIEHRVVAGHAADEILKASEEDIDLIILALERKGLIERALSGSTAPKVIREAHVPVISVPAKKET